MSHECGRSSSEKNYSYNNQSKATDKKCCVTALTGDSKYSNHDRDKRHKTKRLRTRKERCQMRADRRDTSKHKSHHHHCFSQSKKKNTFYSSNHHSCHLPTRKNTQILSTVSQEPSIITESRLLGHHGLFNHEVKSINIERVLSEQSKLEQSEEKTNDNNNTPYLSSTPHNPIVLSSYGLLGADTDVPDKKKAKTGSKTNDDSQDIEMTNLQFSNPGADITSSQRLHQQLPSSCESFKSTNQSKSRFKTTKTKHTESCMSGMDKALHPKPLDAKDKIKTVNKTINEDQDSSSQTDYLVSSPLHVTSLSADNFDQQNLHQDPNNVWKTTHEVAELLSEWLHLPVPNRRNLSSKTREVLLKALQERHGPHLQANLQEMQRSLRVHKDPSRVSNEQEQMIRDDTFFPTDASVKTTGSEHLCWTSSPQTLNNLQQITEEFANPVDTFVKPLDETFKPGSFPFLHMDFEPSGTSVSDLFGHSPISCQVDNVSGPELWETNKCKTQESDLLDSFQKNFVNQSRNVRERLREQQTHHSNVQPSFSHQDRHAADLHVFPWEQNPSETDRFYFAPFFPAKSHSRPQSDHLQAFGQLSPVHQDFWPDPTGMMHYPPSHMLERNLAPPSLSLRSPEHWSFPPMRLY